MSNNIERIVTALAVAATLFSLHTGPAEDAAAQGRKAPVSEESAKPVRIGVSR